MCRETVLALYVPHEEGRTSVVLALHTGSLQVPS